LTLTRKVSEPMPLSIQFQPSKTSNFGGDDITGRFRSGRKSQGKIQGLKTWRATSDDKKVTDAIAKVLGGKSAEWDTTKDDKWEVITEAEALDITLEYLNVQMVLWGSGSGGKPVRVCDGTVRQDAGSSCECPADIRERKAAAKNGLACKPETQALWRLTDMPELGKFRYVSSSYQLADTVTRLEGELADAGGSALATVTLKPVSFESNGQTINFTKPIITIKEPVAA